jgi:hypothetical protein
MLQRIAVHQASGGYICHMAMRTLPEITRVFGLCQNPRNLERGTVVTCTQSLSQRRARSRVCTVRFSRMQRFEVQEKKSKNPKWFDLPNHAVFKFPKNNFFHLSAFYLLEQASSTIPNSR